MPNAERSENSETDLEQFGSVSPYRAGLKCKCPRCGRGALYGGLLDVKLHCDVCGLDMSGVDAGDGAQVFVIMVLGVFTTLLGLFLYSFDLPKWALMLVLIVFISIGSVWMLRIFKAVLIALEFHHDAGQGQLVDRDGKTADDDSNS